MTVTRGKPGKELLKHLLVLSVLAFSFLPFGIMLLISFKDNQQFVRSPFTLTFPLHFEN